ncbi:MarR family transcriptional regulator [Streptomyces collinus]
MVNDHGRRWRFLTSHAHVLLAIARDPGIRLRDIAAHCHIAERTVQSIVADLEHADYLSRERRGRRTRYTLRLDGMLHHPAEAHLSVRELLGIFPPHQRGDEEDGPARTGSPRGLL